MPTPMATSVTSWQARFHTAGGATGQSRTWLGPDYNWRGTVPFAKLPYVYNPPSGFLVAANQQVIGAQYPYPLGWTFSYGLV